jgi:hypothetical protein
MGVVGTFWIEYHNVVLMFIAQFVKINQYCLIAMIYFGFVARVFHFRSLSPKYVLMDSQRNMH